MGFLADLRVGTYGLQFIPPSSWQLEVDRDQFASFRDEAHRVDWYLEFYPLIVDHSIEHDVVLREDLHCDTTAVFESFFTSRESPEGGSHTPADAAHTGSLDTTAGVAQNLLLPRTKRDPTWSPVVSFKHVWIGGAPALEVIHRLTYTAGDELIIGRIVIPLEQGTVYISALRRANMTGVRETVLSITGQLSAQDGDSGGPQQVQAMIDDPALDGKFPDHPLSAIRRALHWALTTPLKMTVRAPLSSEPEKPMVLPRSGCSIHPPPRFRVCSAMAAAMDPSLTPFVRATVPQSGSYSFDVWRVPSVRIKEPHVLQQLRRFAEEHLRGWVRGGDAAVEIECVDCSMHDGLPGVRTYLCFPVNGNPNHAVANWFVDHDGTVFRVCAGGALSRSREELTQVVNDSTLTWKRLPGDSKKLSKWWNVFSR